MSDGLLRRGRHKAYSLRQDGEGHTAKLIEDLCAALDKATRTEPVCFSIATAAFKPGEWSVRYEVDGHECAASAPYGEPINMPAGARILEPLPFEWNAPL